MRHDYIPDRAVLSVLCSNRRDIDALRLCASALAEAGIRTRERFIRTSEGIRLWLVHTYPQPNR